MSSKERPRDLVFWALLSPVAAVFVLWAFPRAFPLFPTDWRLNRHEAMARARESMAALDRAWDVAVWDDAAWGEAVVVAGLEVDPHLEHRLHLASGDRPSLRDSGPGRRIVHWSVNAFAAGERSGDCTWCLEIDPGGEIVGLRIRVPERIEAAIDPGVARARADELLWDLGQDPAAYAAPEPRRVERPGRTDLVVRYRDPRAVLGAETPYGVEVVFAGDQLAEMRFFIDDPARDLFPGPWPEGLLWRIHLLAPFLLLPFLAVPFLRRYHEGQAGHRRAAWIFLGLTVCGALAVAFAAPWNARWALGGTPAWRAIGGFWIESVWFWVVPWALVAALAWAVGEARCRERWGEKLAALDAAVRGRFATAIVARAALRGPAAGLALTAAWLLVLPLMPGFGVHPLAVWLFDDLSGAAAWPGAIQLLVCLVEAAGMGLVGLALLPPAVRRLGRLGGPAVLALVSGVLFLPPLATFPPDSEFVSTAVVAAGALILLLAYDFLTALLATLTMYLIPACLPWLMSDDVFLVAQGAFPLAVLLLPLALAWSGRKKEEEVVYEWRDVPTHARRIAERERRRMELATASTVVRSILPEVPERIGRVELAHAFRPAGEVGGDFYDVTAFGDGRLALALGDVAGHGVASGLVMAMARSALAVQLRSDPAVGAVFRALNRTLHHTARRSLMATLCYGLLDPRRGELVYASAGHPCPYLIRDGGGIVALEAPAYPLGVRSRLEIEPRRVRLAAGDFLFLVSDGIIEARTARQPDPFGYRGLEACLARHAEGTAGDLRDAVLAELDAFTEGAAQDDDQTILALRLATFEERR